MSDWQQEENWNSDSEDEISPDKSPVPKNPETQQKQESERKNKIREPRPNNDDRRHYQGKQSFNENYRDRDREQGDRDNKGQNRDTNRVQGQRDNNYRMNRYSNLERIGVNDTKEQIIEKQENIQNSSGSYFLNQYSVSKLATEDDIRKFYEGIEIKKVQVNKENYKVYDLEFQKKEELLKAVDRGTGVIHERHFYLRYSFTNDRQGDVDEFIIRGNEAFPQANYRIPDNRPRPYKRNQNDDRGFKGRNRDDKTGYNKQRDDENVNLNITEDQENNMRDHDYKYGGGKMKGDQRGGGGLRDNNQGYKGNRGGRRDCGRGGGGVRNDGGRFEEGGFYDQRGNGGMKKQDNRNQRPILTLEAKGSGIAKKEEEKKLREEQNRAIEAHIQQGNVNQISSNSSIPQGLTNQRNENNPPAQENNYQEKDNYRGNPNWNDNAPLNDSYSPPNKPIHQPKIEYQNELARDLEWKRDIQVTHQSMWKNMNLPIGQISTNMQGSNVSGQGIAPVRSPENLVTKETPRIEKLRQKLTVLNNELKDIKEQNEQRNKARRNNSRSPETIRRHEIHQLKEKEQELELQNDIDHCQEELKNELKNQSLNNYSTTTVTTTAKTITQTPNPLTKIPGNSNDLQQNIATEGYLGANNKSKGYINQENLGTGQGFKRYDQHNIEKMEKHFPNLPNQTGPQDHRDDRKAHQQHNNPIRGEATRDNPQKYKENWKDPKKPRNFNDQDQPYHNNTPSDNIRDLYRGGNSQDENTILPSPNQSGLKKGGVPSKKNFRGDFEQNADPNQTSSPHKENNYGKHASYPNQEQIQGRIDSVFDNSRNEGPPQSGPRNEGLPQSGLRNEGPPQSGHRNENQGNNYKGGNYQDGHKNDKNYRENHPLNNNNGPRGGMRNQGYNNQGYQPPRDHVNYGRGGYDNHNHGYNNKGRNYQSPQWKRFRDDMDRPDRENDKGEKKEYDNRGYNRGDGYKNDGRRWDHKQEEYKGENLAMKSYSNMQEESCDGHSPQIHRTNPEQPQNPQYTDATNTNRDRDQDYYRDRDSGYGQYYSHRQSDYNPSSNYYPPQGDYDNRGDRDRHRGGRPPSGGNYGQKSHGGQDGGKRYNDSYENKNSQYKDSGYHSGGGYQAREYQYRGQGRGGRGGNRGNYRGNKGYGGSREGDKGPGYSRIDDEYEKAPREAEMKNYKESEEYEKRNNVKEDSEYIPREGGKNDNRDYNNRDRDNNRRDYHKDNMGEHGQGQNQGQYGNLKYRGGRGGKFVNRGGHHISKEGYHNKDRRNSSKEKGNYNRNPNNKGGYQGSENFEQKFGDENFGQRKFVNASKKVEEKNQSPESREEPKERKKKQSFQLQDTNPFAMQKTDK